MANFQALREDVVLVTGGAGFIGFHLSVRLLREGYRVIALDNLNSYYEVSLKEARLRELRRWPAFTFLPGDIADREFVERTFEANRIRVVINLAAQAGVRYSLENPSAYIQSNVVGFANILEACRWHQVDHLLYASSSSVYGGNEKVPFLEDDRVDHPVSLYAATKRSNELMADAYAHLYGIPATGLRFFTVYGPYGRPDMAYFGFVRKYFRGESIRLFRSSDESEDLSRDFTYIDDVVESVARVMTRRPEGPRPHEILNVGGSAPVSLTVFVFELERALSEALRVDVSFGKEFVGVQAGDVHTTYADASRLRELTGYAPATKLEEGLARFARWYVGYYGKG